MAPILRSIFTQTRGLAGISLGLALLTGPAAEAQTVYALGTLTAAYMGSPAGSQGLVTINVANGVAVGTPATVAGVAVGQSLVGMDFRPANAQLYALGYDTAAVAPTPNTQLYTLNLSSGAATPVGAAVRLELGRRTARIGFDFNPVADLIRVVSTTRANYRLSPITGALAGTDTNLAYASGTPATPGIGAVAYTNAFPGATSTTLYAFDELNNGLLSVVNPPNGGVLTAPVTVMFQVPSGTYGIGSPQAIDFDIYSNASLNRNEGFLMEVTAGGSSNFYRFNLSTGLATLVGNTVPAALPFVIRDIAVSIGAPLATAPAALAQLAAVYPNPARGTATLLLPAALRGNQPTLVTVADNLGRPVLTRTLPAGPAETVELPLAGLAPGVYTVLANAAAGRVARRLAVE
ncbi:DUF4394 domain-containing protein [Microvirga sp. STS02]|uniref:DUF4394 domain-containing protein n=1 Tax=Hymenobacter negativus TaxID=2795026 RepID=UPI0018DC3DA1|nr:MULTISPECIES: DUF4394 domain-containing protein [Bacteria]MBH8567640.1 DUF4394 domain-containing protein [Hymenobacter negativus]MBR7207374.1 DUF4394 domain-containing protein [Microvirga sp. STS02]